MRRIIRIPSHGAGGRSFDMEAAGSTRKGLVQGYLKVTVIIKTKKKKKGKICDGKKARAAGREVRVTGRQPSGESQRVR